MDRRAWQATVHGVVKSQTRLKQLSTHLAQPLSRLLFPRGEGTFSSSSLFCPPRPGTVSDSGSSIVVSLINYPSQ